MTDDGCITASGNTHGLQLRHIFSMQDGKIHEVSYGEVANTEDWDRYEKWLEGEGAWASAYRAEESSKTDRNVSSDAGEVAIKLCQDYADFLEQQVSVITASAQALVDAINSGDVDAAVALLTDDAEVTFRNDTAAGKDQLSSLVNWLAGKETQYQITDCVWQGDRLVCSMSVVDGCIAASGAPEGLPGMMIVNALEDGTLRNVVSVLSLVERKPYEAWLEAETAWASANRADEFAQAEGYSKEAGAMAIRLCQEYVAAMQAQSTAPQDPTAIVQIWLDAINDGDLDAAMALMTPDAVIPGTGAPNRPARNVVDWWIDLKTRFGDLDCQQSGDKLVCNFIMTDDGCIAASGNTQGLPISYTVDMQDGKIHTLVLGPIGGADWSRYGKWSQEEMAWVTAFHADEIAGIDWDSYSTGGGDIVVKLCQEYAETLK
jgi:ketosteroid isomerase-like protein